MKWFKRKKKCFFCFKKLKPPYGVLKYKDSEGLKEVDICKECADIFDKAKEEEDNLNEPI